MFDSLRVNYRGGSVAGRGFTVEGRATLLGRSDRRSAEGGVVSQHETESWVLQILKRHAAKGEQAARLFSELYGAATLASNSSYGEEGKEVISRSLACILLPVIITVPPTTWETQQPIDAALRKR